MSTQESANKLFLHPGDFCFTDLSHELHTLLGSCIAITLWHPKLQIGGMCHFVLPQRSHNMPTHKLDGRYGTDAWEMFRRETSARGTRLSDYQGKVFGGANVIGASNNQDLVGRRNAEQALNMMIDADVGVEVAHVGETGHRRIIFEVDTGDVWVKHESADGNLVASTTGRS